jgi:nickel/cobalt exporter
MVPQRIEAWMAVATGILVIAIGLWTLWTQRDMLLQLQGVAPAPGGQSKYRPLADAGHVHAHDPLHAHAHGHDHSHDHGHDHSHDHEHGHEHDHESGAHSHGWGFKHTHDLKLATTNRPGLWMLIWLGIAGGLLPDPVALSMLLNLLAQGKAMQGLIMVLVFSLGFAATLVAVGVIAAFIGRRILDWLAGVWAMRIQVGTSLLIVLVGVILTVNAARLLNSLG